MTKAYDIIAADVYSVEQTFAASCVDKNIRFEAEAGFAIQSLMGSDYAMKIATENRQSVINAVTNIAAIGISLNPAKKQAYLVPRDHKICLDISYMGLMDLAIASGSIKWGQCRLVHEADDFELIGIDKEPVHKFKPFAKERGPIVGVYSVVKTIEGDYLTHTMELSDVFDIRDRSSAWKAWVEKKKKCPWVTDEGEMVKKTCIKQAYKYWPKTERSGRLESAIHYLNEEAGEGLHKEPETKGPGIIKGTDGAMESLSIEVQNYMRELAAESQELFRVHGVAQAFDRIKIEELDEVQSVALWSLLPSDMRTALKAEGKERKAAAETVGS
jgi:recombination protein RecT